MKSCILCDNSIHSISKFLNLINENADVPWYQKEDKPDDAIHAIAIDSTGLKRFGRGEWHQEKYELSSKASWRKLHLAINQDHYVEACVLIDRFSHDDQQVTLIPILRTKHRPEGGGLKLFDELALI